MDQSGGSVAIYVSTKPTLAQGRSRMPRRDVEIMNINYQSKGGLPVRLYSRDVLRFSERSDLEPQKGRLPGSVIRQTTINDISCRICMPRPRQREPTVPNLTCFTEGVRLNVPRVRQMSQKLQRERDTERERERGARAVLS